jgi:hypothetical protein
MPRAKTLILCGLLVLLVASGAWLLWKDPAGGDHGVAAPAARVGAASETTAQAKLTPTEANAPANDAVLQAPRSAVSSENLPAFDLANARWIEGQVSIPAGAPQDPTLLVIVRARAPQASTREALDRESDAASEPERPELDDDADDADEPLERPLPPEPKALSSAPVGADGGFRIALPPDVDALDLDLRGRFLYLEAGLPLATLDEHPRLEPRLGAWITGRLIPPRAGGDAFTSADLVGVRVALTRVEQSFERIGSRSYYSGPRRADTDTEGRFELRAVPAPSAYVCAARPRGASALDVPEFKVEAGDRREFEIELVRGGTLSGVVVDEQGDPIARARVNGVRFGGNMMALAGAGNSARRTRSAADGTFTLAGLPPGRVRVMAERKSYLTSLGTSIEVADGEHKHGVELRLETGGAISGRVVWPDGTPAVGATIKADIDPAQMTGMGAMTAWRGANSRATSAADGSFKLVGLGKGPFQLRAKATRDEAGEKSTGAASLEKIAPGVVEALLTLQPTLTLAGRVVDAQQAPRTSFEIRYEPVDAQRPFWLGTASKRTQSFADRADGTFEVLSLEPGRWKVHAVVADYGNSDALEVDLPASTDAELVLVVKASVSAAGLVVAPDGTPVAGARVRAVVGSGPWAGMQGLGEERPEATSDAQGRFSLRGLDAGRTRLAATAENWAPSETLELDLAEGAEAANLRLELRTGGRILGEVYAKDGKPSSGKSVMASHTTGGDSKMTGTDSDGHFEIAHVRPGKWQLVSMGAFDQMFDAAAKSEQEGKVDPAAWMNEMKMAMVEVEDGKDVHVLLGAPPADPIKVSGKIVAAKEGVQALASFLSEGGSPLGGIKLASSDADGRFEIELDHPGSYTISIQQMTDGMGRQNTIEFTREIPKAPTYDLVLELPLGSISGVVYGPDGQPLQGARVSLSTEGAIQSGFLAGGQYSEIVTNDRGSYRIPWLRAGTYSVGAGGSFLGGLLGDRSPHGRQVRSGLRLSEGQALEGIDFRLTGAGEIKGRVSDAQDKPVEGAALFLRDSEGRLLERVSMSMTDSGGHYSISGIAEGEYTVSARQGSLASADSTPVRVRAGEKSEANVRLGAGTMLLISLVDEEDQPTKASVIVLDSNGRQVNGMLAFSDMTEAMQKGFTPLEQRVGPLPPGSYKVTAIASNGVSKTKPVTLNGQPERSMRIKLKD